MSFDWQFGQFLWEVIVSLAVLGNGVAMFFARRSSANKDALSELENLFIQTMKEEQMTRINSHRSVEAVLTNLRERINTSEETLKHLPTGNDIAGVKDVLTIVAKEVSELRGAQSGTTRMVERMNDFLMSRSSP